MIVSTLMDTPATVNDYQRFLANVFDGWDSTSPIEAVEPLPVRHFSHTRIKVGVLTVDHPLSPQQIKNGVTEQKRERRAGQPVYFGLGLNYETGVVDWAWRDVKNSGISPQYVTLDNGQSNITIRANAMYQYDTHERNRIRNFNSSQAHHPHLELDALPVALCLEGIVLISFEAYVVDPLTFV